MRTTTMFVALAVASSVSLVACEKTEETPGQTTAPATAAQAAEWEGCRELKQKLAGATTVFTDPDYSGEIATWRISAFGANFALPEGDWDVLPSRDDTTGMTVVLLDRKTDETVVWTLEPAAVPGQPIDKRPTVVHKQLMLGYQKTPEDLTCAAAAQTEEAMIAEALVLKDIDAPGETIAIHQGMHALNDISRFSALKDDGQWQWEVWFPTPKGYAQATYRFKDEARARAFGTAKIAAPGQLKEPASEGAGEWLALLETALGDAKNPDSWKPLLAERKKAKASDKSITALTQLAEPPKP